MSVEFRFLIGADSLDYLPVANLKEFAGNGGYLSACFDGRYPTKIPIDNRKNRFEQRLSERIK